MYIQTARNGRTMHTPARRQSRAQGIGDRFGTCLLYTSYIGSLELDGKPLQSVQLPFAEVVGGGTLRVNLAAEPNTQLNK